MKVFVVSVFLAAMLTPTAYAADRPAIHGMLVFGKSTIYLSHLPMFHSPHDYQVIVEAELQDSAQQTYLNDQKMNPDQTLYTLEPLEKFSLPDEIQNLKSFHATLFRGHFERDGIPIATDITVSIKAIVYFHQFDPAAKKPEVLTYLYFGHPGETFLAHWITAAPDFDQVLSVNFAPAQTPTLPANQLYNLLQIPAHTDTLPLDPSDPSSAQASALKQYYLEFDDLSH